MSKTTRLLWWYLALVGCQHPAGPDDLTTITGTEGLALAADGTLYFSQTQAIGRWRPGAEPEPGFVALGANVSDVWGLVLDGERLYAGSPATGELLTIDLSATPPGVQPHVSEAGQPNGLALGPDGTLYYSDFRGGHVYRVGADGARTRVTSTAISRPNGLAVTPGALLVLSFGDGTLLELALGADGLERGREERARSLGSPDGLLVLDDGSALVSDYSGGRLLRVEFSSGAATVVRDRLNSPANVIAGRAENEIYVASAGALVVTTSSR